MVDAFLRRRSTIEKICWICYLGDDEFSEEGEYGCWVTPCACTGSTKYVHESCLLHWLYIQKSQSTSSDANALARCPQCTIPYMMIEDPLNPLVSELYRIDDDLYTISILPMGALIVSSIYWLARSYGLFTMRIMIGTRQTENLLTNSHSSLRWFGLPSIPIILFLAKGINWENAILRHWRYNQNFIFRLLQMPSPPPLTNDSKKLTYEQLSIYAGHSDAAVAVRNISSALLLPVFASVLGMCVFDNVLPKIWQRTLAGGCVWILGKGMLKIYMRQAIFIRDYTRKPANYADRFNPQFQPLTPMRLSRSIAESG